MGQSQATFGNTASLSQPQPPGTQLNAGYQCVRWLAGGSGSLTPPPLLTQVATRATRAHGHLMPRTPSAKKLERFLHFFNNPHPVPLGTATLLK